ncbi:MAG TPA: SRPBCC family protein [Pseudonocardiaceae bacterium]|jgi:hypothetical protein|nr:SRPBCC family protein [Pseudonocardiaceae bacterium]
MAQVKASARRSIAASVDDVRTALADYAGTRPKLLTEQFSEYEVREGGTGAGTVVHWKLAATSKRVRDCLLTVTEADGGLVESDQNSSMVTTWTVAAEGEGSAVSVETTWNGAGGIGGFFERTFAPGGLRRIYDGMLANLDNVVRSAGDES